MLKKVINFIFIFLLIIFCNGCNKNEDIVVEELFNYYYDFSYYGFDADDKINFKESTVGTLLDTYNNKDTCVFVISSPTCISCKRLMSIVNDIAISHDFIVYSIDPYSHIYPVFDDENVYHSLLDFLNPYILSEDDFVLPIVLVINNGNIDSYMIGYEFIDNDTLINQIDSVLSKFILY